MYGVDHNFLCRTSLNNFLSILPKAVACHGLTSEGVSVNYESMSPLYQNALIVFGKRVIIAIAVRVRVVWSIIGLPCV